MLPIKVPLPVAERGVQGAAKGGVATALVDGVCKWQAVYKKPKKKYLRRAKKWKAKARNQAAER